MNRYIYKEGQKNKTTWIAIIIKVVILILVVMVLLASCVKMYHINPEQPQYMVSNIKYKIVNTASVGRYGEAGVTVVNVNNKSDIKNISLASSHGDSNEAVVDIEVDYDHIIGSYLYYSEYITSMKSLIKIVIKSN